MFTIQEPSITSETWTATNKTIWNNWHIISNSPWAGKYYLIIGYTRKVLTEAVYWFVDFDNARLNLWQIKTDSGINFAIGLKKSNSEPIVHPNQEFYAGKLCGQEINLGVQG